MHIPDVLVESPPRDEGEQSMAETLQVAVLDGSYFTPSKTTVLLDAAVRELGRRRAVSVREVSVAELGPGFTGALARDQLSKEALAAVESFERADVVLAGSPVYKGSYTGLFKHFLDFVDAGALVGTPVLLAANGSSDRHLLMIDQELRPLFAFFQAVTAPLAVYGSGADFDELMIVNRNLNARITRAVEALLPLLPD